MSKNKDMTLSIPEKFVSDNTNLENVADDIIKYASLLVNDNLDQITKNDCSDEVLEPLYEQYYTLSKVYGKYRQEHGVIYFEGNELFTRNTLTGLKLSLVMRKLKRARSIWGEQLTLDYDSAKELIEHFSRRYLTKEEEEDL